MLRLSRDVSRLSRVLVQTVSRPDMTTRDKTRQDTTIRDKCFEVYKDNAFTVFAYYLYNLYFTILLSVAIRPKSDRSQHSITLVVVEVYR